MLRYPTTPALCRRFLFLDWRTPLDDRHPTIAELIDLGLPLLYVEATSGLALEKPDAPALRAAIRKPTRPSRRDFSSTRRSS